MVCYLEIRDERERKKKDVGEKEREKLILINTHYTEKTTVNILGLIGLACCRYTYTCMINTEAKMS